MKNLIPVLFAILINTACSSDDDTNGIAINKNEYEVISEGELYEDLQPKNTVDYLEAVIFTDSAHILFSEGEICKNAEAAAECQSQFKALLAQQGFAGGCLPSSCYTFLRYQVDGENKLVSSDAELLEFLGNINSKSDALLLIRSKDYYWGIDNLETGAIKETEDGYEVIVTKVVKFCSPVQTNRYHLKISRAGEITILEEEVYEVNENACV